MLPAFFLGAAAAAAQKPAPLTASDFKAQVVSTCKAGLGADGVIVTLKQGASRRSRSSSPQESFAAGLRARWRHRRLQEGKGGRNEVLYVYSVVSALAARLDDEELTEVLASNEVEKVSPNCRIQLSPEENPPAGGDRRLSESVAPAAAHVSFQENPPWGLDRIDARSGLDNNYTYGTADGTGTVVYVLDTGVRTSHIDFGGRAQPGFSAQCETGTESSCGTNWVYQGVVGAGCSGHGTHCASTIAGKDYGVAKGATIVAVQVLDCTGSGTGATVLAGINWAVLESTKHTGRSVISMSLGGSVSAEENAAVEAAHQAGISVVVAAGNENSDACGSSPASAVNAITVGSTTSTDAASSFSNWGQCVDVYAPGSSITAAWVDTDTSTNTISGTSMACPHVSGAVAQLLSLRPSLTTDRVSEVTSARGSLRAASGHPPLHGLRGFLARTLPPSPLELPCASLPCPSHPSVRKIRVSCAAPLPLLR